MRKYQKLKQNQINELNNVIFDTQSSSVEVRRAQAVLLLNNGSDPTLITGYSHRQCFDIGKIRKLYSGQKILLLWDGPGWHRGIKVKEFLNNDGNIEVIYFPRYSPEENPQEHVWKEGRSQVTHNRFIENIDTATNEFVNYLNSAKFNYSLLGLSAV